MTFVRLPPGRGYALVPAGDRRATAASLALLTPSRRMYARLVTLAKLAVTVGGTRLLPGERVEWEPPMSAELWAELTDQWRATVTEFDALALYQRPQASRSGLGALLLREGQPAAFVKVRSGQERLDKEHRVLEAFAHRTPMRFSPPRPLGRGTAGDWGWLALTCLPTGAATPWSRRHVGPVTEEISDILDGVLPRTADMPAHWRTMHGDLAPWNLRQASTGKPWLIDWEDAAWAPPSADVVYYAAVRAVVYRESPAQPFPREATDFWLAVVSERSETDEDAAFNTRLRSVLNTHAVSP